jgi:hypothetical protein
MNDKNNLPEKISIHLTDTLMSEKVIFWHNTTFGDYSFPKGYCGYIFYDFYDFEYHYLYAAACSNKDIQVLQPSEFLKLIEPQTTPDNSELAKYPEPKEPEFEFGELVEVTSNEHNSIWHKRKFITKADKGGFMCVDSLQDNMFAIWNYCRKTPKTKIPASSILTVTTKDGTFNYNEIEVV